MKRFLKMLYKVPRRARDNTGRTADNQVRVLSFDVNKKTQFEQS